jgi:two-component system, cell cycle sensor histidine kinase and response regulator CckA
VTDLALDLRPLFAYSESGGVHRPFLDLRPIAANVAELLASVAAARGIELCVSSDTEPVVGPICPARIQQLLVALALNAIHAQPDGGAVRIGAHSDCRPYVQQGLKVGARSYVCLVVDDHGMGISPDVQARMFEPFFTTRRPGEGNGLGLAAVAVIVEDHRGFIGVETAPHGGTRMTIFLPR